MTRFEFRLSWVLGFTLAFWLPNTGAFGASTPSLPSQLEAIAGRTYSPSRIAEGRIDLPAKARLTIPASLPLVSGNAGATDFLRVKYDEGTSCFYRGNVPLLRPKQAATAYEFVLCLPGKWELDHFLRNLFSALKLKPGNPIETDRRVAIDVFNGKAPSPTIVQARFAIAKWYPSVSRAGTTLESHVQATKKSGSAYSGTLYVGEESFVEIPNRLEVLSGSFTSTLAAELVIDSGAFRCRYRSGALETCRNAAGSAVSGGGFTLRAKLALEIPTGNAAGDPLLLRAPFRVRFGASFPPPTLVVGLAPPILTKTASLSFPVTVLSGAPTVTTTVRQNGALIAQSSALSFTVAATLREGLNTFEVRAVDSRGGAAEKSVGDIVLDTRPPVLFIESPLDGATIGNLDIPVRGSANEPLESASVNGRELRLSEDRRSFTGAFPVDRPGQVVLEISATDRLGHVARQVVSVRVEIPNEPVPPVDPATVAPEGDPSLPTDFSGSIAFLYSGPNPIQTDASPEALDPEFTAVVRGRVISAHGTPLPGVTVRVGSHPEYGRTITRADGGYDLAVNGGAPVTLTFEKDQFLTARRTETVGERDYSVLSDVALVRTSAEVTPISTGPASPAQVARAEKVTDSDGPRRATVFFPAGTGAELVFSDGTRRPAGTLSIRATEYTVGPNGPAAMPAILPNESAYTYAVELNADEAVRDGARSIAFNQPVYHYVENFLGFPIGTPVPAGYYDTDGGEWVASENGQVVRILGVSGGLAEIDVSGNGTPASAAELLALRFTSDERARLADLYPPGQSIWRTPMHHFSTWDLNYPTEPAESARLSANLRAQKFDANLNKQPTITCASIIERDNQILRESVPVPGTPFSLNYASDRNSERMSSYSLRIPLTGNMVPPRFSAVVLETTVGGVKSERRFAMAPRLNYDFTWSSRDAYGRRTNGTVKVGIKIGYIFDPDYVAPAAGPYSFGVSSAGPSTGVESRTEMKVLVAQYTTGVGTWDQRSLGLGGWSLDQHHYFDANSRTLFLGDGTKRESNDTEPRSLTRFSTVADSGPVAVANGIGRTLFVARPNSKEIWKIDSRGTSSFFASGTGAPAGLAWSSINSRLYVTNLVPGTVSFITPDGRVHYFAGGGTQSDANGAILRSDLRLTFPTAIAAAADGTVFVAGAGEEGIHRLATNLTSTRIPNSANVMAGDVAISMAVNHEGNRIYVAMGSGRLLEFTTYGEVRELFVGLGQRAVAVSPSGEISFLENGRLYTLVDGEPVVVAGGGNRATGNALQSSLGSADGLAIESDGTFYISNRTGSAILRIRSYFPNYNSAEFTIASTDGTEVYRFDRYGRHLQTLDAFTGGVRYTFSYSTDGFLERIRDGNLNETVVAREGSAVEAISSPYGVVTKLMTNESGYLASIENSEGDVHAVGYHPGTGLIATFTDPNGNTSRFTYDTMNGLSEDRDALGGIHRLGRTLASTREFSVLYRSPDGVTDLHSTLVSADGTARYTDRFADGSVASRVVKPSGESVSSLTDGTVITSVSNADPRFGLEAAYETNRSVRLPNGETLVTTEDRNFIDQGVAFSLETTRTLNGLSSFLNYRSDLRRFDSISRGGRTANATLDPLGRIQEETHSSFTPIRYGYDSKGRLESITQGPRVTTFEYDPSGFLESVTNPLGQSTRYAYDRAGRVVRQTRPDNRSIEFTYDRNGNLRSVAPPEKPPHVFTYSPLNLATTYAPPATNPSGTTHYEYTFDRKPKRILRPDGTEILYAYHPTTGQLVSVTTPEGVVRYFYKTDGTGQVDRVEVPQGVAGPTQSTSYEWNGPFERLTTWSGNVSGFADLLVTMEFKDFVRRAQVSFGDEQLGFRPHIYQYDGDLLLAQTTNGRITRDTTGLMRVYDTFEPVPARTTFDYNSFGELIRSIATKTENVLRLTYTRDSIGRIAAVTEVIPSGAKSKTYHYDSTGRLESVDLNGTEVSRYVYDANGNRLSASNSSGSETATYDDQDRLTRYGSDTFTYNENGELVSRTGSGGTTNYAYTAFGQLRSVKFPNGTTIAYVIDDQGRRVGRRVGGPLQEGYLYGTGLNRVEAVIGPDGATTASFLYGTKGNAPDAMDKRVNGIVRHFDIISDERGSPRFVTDESGAIVQEIDYDEFGVMIKDTNPGFQPFGFAGCLYDRDTKLCHFGAREYDASTGRWLTKDPILFAGGDTNLYGYVLNDPINFIDPTGLDPSFWQKVQANASQTSNALGLGTKAVGALTAGTVARAYGTSTALNYALSGFAAIAPHTGLETALVVSGATLGNAVLSGVAFGTGIYIGSILNVGFDEVYNWAREPENSCRR